MRALPFPAVCTALIVVGSAVLVGVWVAGLIDALLHGRPWSARGGRQRGVKRAVVLVVLAALSVSVAADPAGAVSAKVSTPALSFDFSGLWSMLRGKPKPDFGRLPKQAGGTAAGHGHRATAASTKAHAGVGRKPGKGKGQLPSYSVPAKRVRRGLSGRVITGFVPGKSRRVSGRSTATSDYFQNADGTYTRKMAMGVVNYKDAGGNWKAIDTSLEVSAGNRLGEKANSLAVDFAPSGADPALVRVSLDGGHVLAYSLQGAAAVPAIYGGSYATYRSVLPATDLRLQATSTGSKESLILHSADAANSWTFPLALKGLTPVEGTAGAVNLLDAGGKLRLVIPPAYAYDSKISKRTGDPASTHAINYRIDNSGPTPSLVMTLDPAWLHDKSRVFPVTVDPSNATGWTTETTYAQSGSPGDHSQEQYLKVNGGNAISFLQFPDLGLDGSKVTVQAASLQLTATWSSQCTAQPIYVAAVSQAWTPGQVTTYPGPSYGSQLGTATPSVPNSCANSGDPSSANITAANTDAVNIPLSVGQFNTWATSGATDHGLAVYASVAYRHFISGATTSGYLPDLYLTYYGAAMLPVLAGQAPTNGAGPQTLTPELYATGTIDPNLTTGKFEFQVEDADGNTVVNSGMLSGTNYGTWRGHWMVPAGKLQWGKTYYWSAVISDGTNVSVASQYNSLTPQVPQPVITSSLTQNSDTRGFDPANGDYTTSATDANVAVTGPSLSIERNYNSRDPRTTGAFGAAWSSVADSRAVEQYDATGAVQSVVVTYPTGSAVGFGKNSDGTFSPPSGRFSTFKAVTGGYSLTDKDDTTYTFTQSVTTGTYGITSITDAKGRTETFGWSGGEPTTITSGSSGRTLSLEWSTPAGATSPHVDKVTTDPATAGQASTALTWQYTYTGDQLSKVCSPVDTTGCTQYGYTATSGYPAQVLDRGPQSFWPLAESTGTTAGSQVLANEGADNATYGNVTLGQTGPLTGGTATAAGFNGTSSYVQLPNMPFNVATDRTVALWFKTSSATPQVLLSFSHDPLSAGTSFDINPVLYIGTDGKLKGMLWPGSGNPSPLSTAGTVVDGNWHHVVLSGSSTTQTMWLDGTKIGPTTGSDANAFIFNATPATAEQVYVGAGFLGGLWPDEPNNNANPAPVRYFNGSIAQVSLFGRALVQADVTALRAAATQPSALLSSITRPSGNPYAAITYDPLTSTVTQVTDDQGGNWGIGKPVVTGSSQVYRAAVLGSAPAHYFRLGEGAGAPQAADEVNSGPATYSSVTLGASGPFADQTAASFNGTSSYLTLPAGDQVQTSPGSVEMWFKMPAGNTAGGVLFDEENDPLSSLTQAGGGYVPALYVGTDGGLHGKFWDTNGTSLTVGSTVAVNDGVWHHVVLAAGTSSQTLYLDGVAQGTLSAALKTTPAQYSYIGAGEAGGNWPNHPTNTLGWFPGSIAEVAFYHAQLSGQDVAHHFQAGRNSVGLAPVETVQVTDPSGHQITYQYDPWNGNRQIGKIDALGNKTTYGYDSSGFLNTLTDPNGDVTLTGHDVRGNEVSQTTCQNQAAQACSTSYTSYLPDDTTSQLAPGATNDLVASSSDGRSTDASDTRYQTRYGYDAAGDKTAVITPPVPGFPSGRKTTISYTDGSTIAAADSGYAPKGLPYRTVSPGGAVSMIGYFHNGDVAAVTDAAGQVTRFTYDNLGRVLTKTVVSDTYPAGLTTSYVYNGMGLVTQETDPGVTNHVTGNVHTAVITRVYDADGQVTSETTADPTGHDASRTTTTGYNAHGLVTSTTDANNLTTTLAYDAYGNKTSETDPSGSTTAYTYDANGDLLTQTLQGYTGDPGNPQPAADLIESSRAYDPAGRLASITDSMGNTTSYTYTDNGLTSTITRTDFGGHSSYVERSTTYDGAGNPTRQVTNNGATVTQQTVDAADRTDSTTVDPGGANRKTTLSYTADDQVATSTVSDGSATHITSATYDAMGRPTSRSVQQDGIGHPAAWWPLSQSSGTAVTDTSGSGNTAAVGGNTATLAGGVTWAGQAANFPATSGQQIATGGQVLDTTGSFSVSAWVNMTTAVASGSETVLSQEAGVDSGFLLKYDSAHGTWYFVRPKTDVSGPAVANAIAGTAAVTGTWTHLVGVYNVADGSMTLYVNGAASGTASDTTPIASTGPLVIGRSKWNSTSTDLFNGRISNVQVYPKVLSASDVSSMYASGRGGTTTAGQPAGWWKLDQASGTSVTDLANAGVSWSGQAATFQGVNGQQIASTGPAVDTTGSFSVSAWVNMSVAVASGSETALSQEANVDSGFLLKYDSSPKKWVFYRPTVDTTTPGVVGAYSSALATTGTWTHLVGVFNASDSSMTLYVNGAVSGTATDATPIASTGPLVIGRVKWKNLNTDFFRGSVGNVQMYGRALTAAEVSTLYNGGRTGGTTASSTSATVKWNLDQRGLPTSMTDPDNNITNYTYDEAGRLAVTVGPGVNVESGGGAPALGHPTAMAGYDTFGEQTDTQDPGGNWTKTAYDAGGRKVRQTLPDYTPPGSSTTVTAHQTWAYDSGGNVTDVTDPLSHVTHYVYDQLGDVSSITDANNGVTRYTYDTNGQRLSVTSPSGAQSQATYDFLGRPVTSTVLERYPTATSATTTNSYTASTANPGGAFLAATTSPDGAVVQYGYDNVGETTRVTDPAGAATTTAYDLLGRPTTVTKADGTATRTAYDQLNDVLSVQQTDTDGTTILRGTSATYDAAGRQMSATDARGHTIGYTRDARGLITQEVQPVDGTTSITTSFGYDAAGNRTRFTDGRSNSWTYTYNSWNLPESAVQPVTPTYTSSGDRTSTIGYDAASRPASMTEPGGVSVSYGYDNVGNLTGQSGSGADASTATRSFGYDADNRMTSAATGAAGTARPATSETFGYNDRGALLTATGSAGTSSFGYNNDGLPTSRTDAAGTASYTYDAADRPATTTDAATGTVLTYGYNQLSQPTSIAYGSGGDTRTFGYDHLHRLTGDTLAAPGGTIASISYGYDANDNETSKVTTGFSGAGTNTYTYDYADRLTSWNNGTTATAYAYDASGNRIQAGANVYTYDARDQLTSDGVNGYTYTARGTLSGQTHGGITVGATSDAFGQQVSQDTAAGQTRTYLTDALGRVTSATGAGATDTLSYSGTGNTVASDGVNTYGRDAGGSLLGIGTVGGSPSSAVLALTDQHDDVVADFTATGTTLTASVTYDPLGNVTAGSGLAGRLGYQSGWTDGTTGKVSMAARWYSPVVGQFQNHDTASLDPIPNSAAANPFAYVDGNPLNRTDPTGHGWWSDVTSAASDTWDSFSGGVSDTWNTVTSWASDAWDWAATTWNSVSSWASDQWNSAQNWATTQYHKVTTYVSDGYNWAKRKLEEAKAAARRAAAKAAAKAKDAYDKLHEIGKYAGTQLVKAVRTTATFVKNHAAAIGSFVASAVVFTGCEAAITAVTGGTLSVPGAMLCGAAAGAVGGLVNQGVKCAQGQKGACSASAFGNSALIGGVGGAVGGGVGGSVGGLFARTALSDVLPGFVGDAVVGTSAGGISGGAGGAVTYGLTCSATTTGCSWSGAANATLQGAESGAVTGGLAGGLGGLRGRASGSGRTGGKAVEEEPAPTEEQPSGGCSGSPVPHSFAGSTNVLMADGTAKPISQIKVGDKIANAVPGQDGKPRTGIVTRVIITHDDHDFADLTITTHTRRGPPAPATKAALTLAAGSAVLLPGDPGHLTTTWHHPFYDITQAAFVDADHLHPGDQLQQPDGHPATVQAVRLHHATQTTYDLTIATLHTYYVEAGTTPVLVHNCGEQNLYRAVKNDELTQIHSTRTFSNPQGIETKYFSTTEEGAAAYAKAAYGNWPGEGAYTIIRTTVKSDLLNAEDSLPYLSDGGGGIAGYAIPTDTLPVLGRPRILPYAPIP